MGMSMEFGWWFRDPEEGKFQIRATWHGRNLEWKRKQGHHNPWETHEPTDGDWEKLLDEAGTRVPRRLMSPKQYEELRDFCSRQRS